MHGTARGSKSVPRSLNHQTTRRFLAKVSSDSKSNDDDEMAFCVKGNFICDVYRILRFSDPLLSSFSAKYIQSGAAYWS